MPNIPPVQAFQLGAFVTFLCLRRKLNSKSIINVLINRETNWQIHPYLK